VRELAALLGPAGIQVNMVSPGGVFAQQPPSFVERYSARVPLGRMAEPSDLVGALVFLCGNGSDYVTGQNLVVDGGWTTR
jgi:NAD(P)-dependent dehydrogenase (short-subunit alcohol dehydrogenase family)